MTSPRLDPSINIGQLAQIFTLLVGIAGLGVAWGNLRGEQRVEREARLKLEEQFVEMKLIQDRNWDRLERRMQDGDADIKAALLRIEERLNSMLTPQRAGPR